MRHPLPITSLLYFLIPQSTIPIAANATGFTGNWLPMGGENPSPSNGISRNLPRRNLGPHHRRSVQPLRDLHYQGAVRNELRALSEETSCHTMRQHTTDQENTQTHHTPGALQDPLVRPRILIVDHDDRSRLAASHRLAQWGFDTVGEDNGVSALALLAHTPASHSFAGMLLEMDMPVLGGMAVLQEMKDRHPAIPVLVMAEARHIDKLRSAVSLWAREYLVKPFDTELLKMKCLYSFSSSNSKT